MAAIMRMPGQRRSQEPDEVGQRAGLFAESIRDGDMDLAWAMLSKETRGMRMGVWATRNSIDMQVAYRAAYDANHPMRASLLDDFRTTVLRLWPLGRPVGLGRRAHPIRGRRPRFCLSAFRRHRRDGGAA